MSSNQPIRVPVMNRLVEQAMIDESFRAIARDDLDRALQENGYDLNERERALVFRFRDALSEAGIDVFLAQTAGTDVGKLFENVGPEELERMLQLQSRTPAPTGPTT
ncbi:MAG: hypothetical protein ACR2OE_01410 [Thermomicrobiales bacterium]